MTWIEDKVEEVKEIPNVVISEIQEECHKVSDISEAFPEDPEVSDAQEDPVQIDVEFNPPAVEEVTEIHNENIS